VFNFYNNIRDTPHVRKLSYGETLIAIYNCGLDKKYAELWSHYNYIVYVVEGRKIWHTAQGSYDLKQGSCVLVRKGASIVEQFFDVKFCLILFFIPDEFIYEVLKSRRTPISRPLNKFDPVIPIHNSAVITTFFQSMLPHFDSKRQPDPSLLELKFRELVLTLAENPENTELLSYFASLMNEPQHISLQRVMEDNFCFNLRLDEFARLCSRSLSAFKRDFYRLYNTTPGKWLMEKRLNHSLHLLTNMGRTVSETAFECGFESASHFSRAFRQRFGMSPASIRLKVAV